MASLFGALGSLAESYGLARQNIISERQKEAEARLEEERVQQEGVRTQLEQARLKQEQDLANRPMFLGNSYTRAGKDYIRTWDPHAKGGQGALGEMELGVEENPLLELQRQVKEAGGDITPLQALNILHPQAARQSEYEKTVVMAPNAQGKLVPTIAFADKADPSKPLIFPGGGQQTYQAYERQAAGADEDITAADKPTIDLYSDLLVKNRLSLDQLAKIFTGKKGIALRSAITTAATQKGWNAQSQLTAASSTALETTLPTLKSVNELIGTIEQLGLDHNNTPGYLTWQRALYKAGMDAPAGTLGQDISQLSMDRVLAASSVLKGSSRSLTALQQAMEHTPNVWVASPQQMHTQLIKIRSRLQDVVTDIKKYGTKSGLPNEAITEGGGGASDFGPAPSGSSEGRTGTLPDGTRVKVIGGRLVAQ